MHVLIVAAVALCAIAMCSATKKSEPEFKQHYPQLPKQPPAKKYSKKQLKYFEKKGERFLDEMAKRSDLAFMNGGLMIQKMVEAKPTGRSPLAMDQVELRYTGYQVDGSTFDTSETRKEKSITVRPKHVIECWTMALQMMAEGDKWRVYCPWNLGYGKLGSPAMKVNPYSALYYDIEMVKVLPATAETNEPTGKPFSASREMFKQMMAPDQTPLPADFKRDYSKRLDADKDEEGTAGAKTEL